MNVSIYGVTRFKDNGLRIYLNLDFIRYYQWLIESYYFFTIKTQLPRHGSHITIVNLKLHKNVDISKVRSYNDKRIRFEYNPMDIRIGGQDKDFMNFWIPVKCEEGLKIKRELGIIENNLLHLTICNTKKN